MPDIFPQCLNIELDCTNATHVQEKFDFPIVVADTSKHLLQELIAWEIDSTGMQDFTQGAADEQQVFVASLTLSKPASTEVITEYGASAGTGQTIGNTNVIDRIQSVAVYEDDGTAAANFFSKGGPIIRSLNRGGLGMLIPQDHVWLNVYSSSTGMSTSHVKVGIRLWYRQRPIKAEEYLGLLASRTQETNT